MSKPPIDLDAQARELGDRQASLGVAGRLLKLTAKPDYAVSEVSACLAGDPVLASRLLRAVNASHYGLRNRVGSVERAVAVLGQRALRLLSVSFAVVGGQTVRVPGAWRRSLTIATAASRLAGDRRLSGGAAVDAGEAYTAGLLADIGTIVFVTLRPEVYPDIADSCVHGTELLSAEREMFGLGHPELGARFLSRWKLPETLVDAVARHHDDGGEAAEPPTALTRVVRLADRIGRGIDSADPARVADGLAAWRSVASGADPAEFVAAVGEEVDQAAALFEEDPADPSHRDRVLAAWTERDAATDSPSTADAAAATVPV